LYLREKKSILLEGTQAMPARPSDKDRMGVRMVDSKSLRQRRQNFVRRFITECWYNLKVN
jgi:hypothetical protein